MLRPTLRLLATPSGIGAQSAGLKRVPPALLPPIPLYRRILRTHRKFLPKEMRVLGDEYVKAEFRAHQKIDNPVHIVGFLTEWQSYAQQIEGDSWRGEIMDRGKVDKMSDEQVAQMYELMQAIRKQELEDNDPEYKPHQPPATPEPEK
ncbi:Putative succinate dehydrogenase assembly factor 3 [Septoria linicola]|uniref:Succinate dehydrogenase assembly factor 3 n=1 Tax=Septoria linicola TaxID=215465 RepID=A0A9Q9B841_9PEZI|nr:putative succinate dehydrogenase assembly factor 3 [Septoria linicola]USW59143.1 Putative succinate dehydrogenase assembly factor 3 [Septoria linicola]